MRFIDCSKKFDGHFLLNSFLWQSMSKIQKYQETLNGDTPDHCRGLMTENYLSTNSAFPITYGTVIPVECAPEYTLQGSREVTCLKGIVYSHLARPKCVDPGIQGS